MMTLTKKQITELKEDLLALKDSLEAQIALQEKQTIDTDEVTFADNHFADDASKYVTRQTTFAENQLTNDQLTEVNEALALIDQGTYGICIDTGEAIAFDRLKAIPYAKRTIEAEKKAQETSPITAGEDTTRLRNPDGRINDNRFRTLDKIEEEHD